MNIYTVYDLSTGQIRGHFHGLPNNLMLNVPEGCSALRGSSNMDTQYVDLGTSQLVSKPLLNATADKTACAADGNDVVTIGNLPNPTTAEVSGNRIEVTDGALELTFDRPGAYNIRLSTINRLSQEIVINAS